MCTFHLLFIYSIFLHLFIWNIFYSPFIFCSTWVISWCIRRIQILFSFRISQILISYYLIILEYGHYMSLCILIFSLIIPLVGFSKDSFLFIFPTLFFFMFLFISLAGHFLPPLWSLMMVLTFMMNSSKCVSSSDMCLLI